MVASDDCEGEQHNKITKVFSATAARLKGTKRATEGRRETETSGVSCWLQLLDWLGAQPHMQVYFCAGEHCS
jgi:hypothetical protein